MRILIEQKAARKGFIAALQHVGHATFVYNESTKPAFDAFDELKPDIYIGQCQPGQSRAISKCLTNTGIPAFYMEMSPLAADTLHSSKERKPELKCQVIFVGDYSPAFYKYLEPLVESKYNVKIFGKGWQIPQGMGVMPENRLMDALQSAEIALNLVGPAPTQYLYQILISDLPCVTVPVDGLPVELADVVKSGAEILKAVDEWILDGAFGRTVYSASIHKDILQGHTYIHRVATMFESLGMNDEAERVMKYANQRL